jgi:hypothetical protein
MRVNIPLERMVAVEAIDVEPTAWGGWGYRGSLRLFGRAAWVLRRGEGIRVDLEDGKTFAVTVDHADEGAAVLNRWLATGRRALA